MQHSHQFRKMLATHESGLNDLPAFWRNRILEVRGAVPHHPDIPLTYAAIPGAKNRMVLRILYGLVRPCVQTFLLGVNMIACSLEGKLNPILWIVEGILNKLLYVVRLAQPAPDLPTQPTIYLGWHNGRSAESGQYVVVHEELHYFYGYLLGEEDRVMLRRRFPPLRWESNEDFQFFLDFFAVTAYPTRFTNPNSLLARIHKRASHLLKFKMRQIYPAGYIIRPPLIQESPYVEALTDLYTDEYLADLGARFILGFDPRSGYPEDYVTWLESWGIKRLAAHPWPRLGGPSR